ncbi:MAG: hypothetical protein M3Q49_11990 [Actinomycetota bacterium]|nr:hypothetical protein [Actinomycetota bacterium]
MRVGEPAHAVKFMVKVREEHVEDAVGVLRDCVVPVFGRSGVGEVLVVARRRQFDKLDPEGPGVVDSPVLKRLLESTPPDDPRYVSDLCSLHRDLAGGAHSATHAMSHHHKKERRPVEYEELRRELYAEENRLRVAGYQLDCYALYGSEEDLKADTLDLKGKKMLVPHSARFLAERLDGLLFLRLEGFHQTVVGREFPESPRVGKGLHAAQALVPVLLHGVGDAGARIRSLLSGVASQPGFAGSLALRSRSDGFSGSLGWSPHGLRQHRGDEPEPDGWGDRRPTNLREISVPYELVTLWRNGTDARVGGEYLAGSVPEVLAGALPEERIGAHAGRHVLNGLGELVLWA